MSAESVLLDLLSGGLVVWASGDKFRYTAPAGILTPEMREQIVAHKPALMALLGQERRYALCSFAQQRLWFLHRWAPESAAYNVPLALSATGELDRAALEQSLSRLVQRHGALRTTFLDLAGAPVQVVGPPAPLAPVEVDFTSMALLQRGAAARRFVADEARRPFNLETGPLLRVYVLRMAPQEHILFFNLHHIVCDGWSLGIFVREFGALYRAAVAGAPVQLEDLPLQYTEFAAWQRQWLQGDVLDGQLAYWKQQLTPEPPALNLPLDHPRPAIQTYRGGTHTFALSAPLPAKLRDLCRQEGVTLFMALLAAFDALLGRYSGQTDFGVGVPVANRNRAEIEGLVGFFVNTLVLRADLGGAPSFRELVRRVQQTALDAYAHQDCPFELLVEALQLRRDLSCPPLFQVMFTLQNTPGAAPDLPGLALQPLEIGGASAKFDLSLVVSETEQGINGSITYNADLFESESVARMMQHWCTLLQSFVDDPDRSIQAVSLLAAAEQQQILVAWNDTRLDYPQDQLVQHLFEAQARRAPEAPAVVCGDQTLSYRDLNRRANQLAHYLRGLGVGPEVLVGICMERSPELLIGLLGVLKAGGAYVPLDVMYPRDRLAFMLRDSGAAVVLTQARREGLLPEDPRRVMIRLDSDWESIAQESGEDPQICVSQANLAYMIYTSGSTGRPKGAAILHQGLVNYLRWCEHAYPLAEGRGVPVHSSISFDLTVTSIFAPLVTGQPVHLLPEDAGMDALPAALRSGAAYSLVKLTPVHLSLLAQQLSPEEAAGRTQAFIIGGENLLAEHIAFWQAHAPETALVNEYGPTETVVGCCVYQAPARKAQSGSVPIGRPIINTQLYILDAYLNPVPVGVAGELYIGGAGLARGYHKQPGLTAEKFVPDPIGPRLLGAEPGGRLYRTGDLARWLPDGNIEFLGRIDHQVKVRGFRIETGEIEAALAQHPSVRKAVVLAREDRRGDNRLVAYVAARDGDPLSAAGMRTFLQATLPDYMIPAAFVTLDAIPLTANGKVDRRALPEPDVTEAGVETFLVAPRDTLELQLVQIWEELLDIRPIGVTHDFFALGGHSLLAVRLVSRIRQALGYALPLAILFQCPTVEKLAALLRQRGGLPAAASSLVLLQPGDPKKWPPLFLIHPVGGNVLCYTDLVRRLGPDRPCYGLQAQGLLPDQAIAVAAPHTDIAAMAQHYLALIREVQSEGPYALGGWSMGGLVAYEMACQLYPQKVALILMDAFAPDAERRRASDELSLLAGFARDVGLDMQQGAFDVQELRALPAEERLLRILERAQQAGLIPPDVGPEQAQRLFQVFKRNLAATVAYVPRPYSGPALLIQAGEHTGEVPPWLGWKSLLLGDLKFEVAPGDHYSFVREPNVGVLAEFVIGYITQDRSSVSAV